MSRDNLIKIGFVLFVFLFGIGIGRQTKASNITVQTGLRVNCDYPYGKDGFLTNNCYSLVNMAIRQGYKVSHETVRPDGSVTFIVR